MSLTGRCVTSMSVQGNRILNTSQQRRDTSAEQGGHGAARLMEQGCIVPLHTIPFISPGRTKFRHDACVRLTVIQKDERGHLFGKRNRRNRQLVLDTRRSRMSAYVRGTRRGLEQLMR
jgi:hypothetical protein